MKIKGIVALSLVMVTLIACATGWVMNIVKLCGDDFDPISKAEVIRVIGIPVTPVGIITGFITFDEEK